MVDLTPTSAIDMKDPKTIGRVRIQEIIPNSITSVSPPKTFKNNDYTALNTALGVKYPSPNRATGKDGNRLVWMGVDHAFLIGKTPPESIRKHAVIVDQTDGWSIMRMTGQDCEKVLARLVPIDVRAGVFKRGHTARTDLKQMSVSITRGGAQSFDIMVMRSFARNLARELEQAMKTVAAQN